VRRGGEAGLGWCARAPGKAPASVPSTQLQVQVLGPGPARPGRCVSYACYSICPRQRRAQGLRSLGGRWHAADGQVQCDAFECALGRPMSRGCPPRQALPLLATRRGCAQGMHAHFMGAEAVRPFWQACSRGARHLYLEV
jgi:hypothetical protein